MTELDKHYSFALSEKKWQKFWQDQKTYKWDNTVAREQTFVVDTPPPTVSGQLHMGHIFSYTQADFVVRFKRMIGMNIFYPMGFDDNGLPTERLVEKQRKIRAKDLDRAEFIEICKEVVISEEEKFRALFNNVALSVDWSLEYQTISPRSRTISQMSFLDLAQKGDIYREEQPILWDPVDQTALAQADIEDKEHPSFMNEIIFDCDVGQKLHIATTRPELLPACVAVFFNPEDERYKRLEGKYAITPLFKVKVPILPDPLVSIEKGTGLVMCCTFGDTTDVHWWKIHKLPLKIILNKYGKIGEIKFDNNCLDKAAASQFAETIISLKVGDARAKILEHLKEANLLVKQDPITHSVKCAERSKAPLEIITAPQWFVKTMDYKKDLLKRSEEINWYPQNMKIRLDNWIGSVAWDWCISRQRFFGVPFPVWYSKRKGEEGKPIFADISQLPVDPIKDLPLGYSKDEVEPDKDVMDTWATSAVSPQLSSHAISEKFAVDLERHKKLFPADLRPQAHEIIRTWAFYTLLKANLHENTLPWKNIMISGWCLAEDKSKMSKSVGNIVEPQALLDRYGSDVVRYWASTSRLGADTAYSEEVMKDGKRLVNKLWNAAKFAMVHFSKISNYGENILNKSIHISTDLWIIARLNQVIKKATLNFQNFEYAVVIEVIEEFFWKDFCDNYLELVKVRAYNEEGSNQSGQESGIITLYWVLKTLLQLFAPFIPHITEELYQTIYEPKQSIHSQGMWPKSDDSSDEKELLLAGEYMLEIIELVRKAKSEKNLSVKAEIESLAFTAPVQLDTAMIEDIRHITNSQKIDHNLSDKNILLEGKNSKIGINFV